MGKPHIRMKAEGIPRAAATYNGPGGGAFHGASYSQRDVAAWHASRGSADADLLPDLPELAYRNRDIHRNNGVAHSGVQTIVDNVVGTGLRLSARPNWQALGRTKEWAIEWAANTQSWFHAWWHSTACHAGDTLTGDQLTVQVTISKANNGASLTLPLWIPNRGDSFATKLKTVEVDRLCQPYGLVETTSFRKGIEFDDYGMPLAYHIRKAHPGDRYTWADYASMTWERIPRRTPHGRLRVIHDFDSERPDQSQGIPLMAAILPQFKNIDRYTAAELQAAVMNAMIFATMKTPLSGDEIAEMYAKDPQLWMDERNRRSVKMSSGALIALNPGDELESFMPQRPAAGFGTFLENIYRIIAVGLDMPYELLLKDFSKTTYSSARAAMLEAWRSFNRRRDWLGTMWLDPIYGLFVEELVNDGRIQAPDFYAKRGAYLRCRWIGPGKGWVDPVKEAQAAKFRIDARVSTLEDECAEQGKDWEEVLEQQARELEKRKALGLPEVVASVNPFKAAPMSPQESGFDTTDSTDPANDPANDPNAADEPMAARAARVAASAIPAELAALPQRFAALEAGVLALASRQMPTPTVQFAPGAFVTNVAPPAVSIEKDAIRVETNVPPPPAPPKRQRLKTSGEVVERDVDGRVLKVRVTKRDAETDSRVSVIDKTVVARDESGTVLEWSETEVA